MGVLRDALTLTGEQKALQHLEPVVEGTEPGRGFALEDEHDRRNDIDDGTGDQRHDRGKAETVHQGNLTAAKRRRT